MKTLKFHANVNITPYEFDRQIVERYRGDLFYKDKNGRPVALNKTTYRIAAKKLLKELEWEQNNG